MAAAHDSVGALASITTLTITPTIPNTTAGVFGILLAFTRANTTISVNSGDGSWTSIFTSSLANLSIQVSYRRMTGGDANPTVTAAGGSGAGTFGYIACATGILASGSPLDVAVSSNLAQTAVTDGTALGVTTATSGALVYSAYFGYNDTGALGGWSGSARSGGSPVDRASGNTYESTTATDASAGLASEVIAATGATGNVTMLVALGMTYGAIMVALTPEPVAGGGGGLLGSLVHGLLIGSLVR